MKQTILFLLFALMIGFGAKAQYIYSYTGITDSAWHNEDRQIEININVTLDSIFNNANTHYGIYFSYDITLKHNGTDITSQMPTVKVGNPYNFFDNLRLKIGCGGVVTDVGLIPIINVMGYSGNGLAYNNQSLGGMTSPSIESLWCNEVSFEIGYPGLTVTQLIQNTTLPIELISFDAYKKEREVELAWKTASELNNDYFTIERSVDGMSWENIQTVRGSGNSSSVIDYTWTDYSPYAGVSYYRLSQTDYDGTTEMFNIVSVEQNDIEELQAYPNPVLHSVTVLGVNNSKLLRVMNTVGVEVTGNVIITNSPSKKTFIDMSQLPKGMYFIVNGDESLRVLRQ